MLFNRENVYIIYKLRDSGDAVEKGCRVVWKGTEGCLNPIAKCGIS